MNEKQNKNLSLNKTLLVVSIVLLLISILSTKFSVVRLLLWLTSIIILAINMKRSLKYTTSKTCIIAILTLIVSIIVDGVIAATFNKIPVFTYNIISANNTIVYNSIGMRAWQCDKDDYKNIKVDPFYEKGYMCNANDIETIDINTFLNSVVQNHNEYKNKYVKIKGKISKKSGLNSIEMRSYTKTDIQVNGYVEFADNITLKIIFKDDKISLDSYDVYDEITVVGIIKNMESINENHTIYLSDTELVSSINLDEHTITITKEDKCSTEPIMIHTTEEYNLYSYCLKDIIVTYPDGQYELSTSLSSNKLSIKELYDNTDKIETNPEDNSTMYKLEDYSVLVCDKNKSKDIFIGTKKLKFTNVKCKEIAENNQ